VFATGAPTVSLYEAGTETSGRWYAGPVAQPTSTAATIGARNDELRMIISLRDMNGVTGSNCVIWIRDDALVSVQS
jgi:hypothetical protein